MYLGGVVMSDIASKKVDKEIQKLEKKIEQVYSEAAKDLDEKLKEYGKKHAIKNDILYKKVESGEIEWDDYSRWLDGQIFQGEQWEAKKNQMINTMNNANNVAIKMVNGSMYGVFADNANYEAYTMEHGFGVNFGFQLYDEATVTNLIKNDPKILPEWKINEKKSYVWNSKKVNNAITQGIIQGEKLDQISKRLTDGLSAQNENLMKTFARTGMTQAQNAGRYQRQMDAKKLGINMVKEWMATLDGRTRDSHRHMDGEKIKVGDKWHPQKFSNGCRYPGDPEAPAREVYNCRCTLVADLVDYPSEYERYDNIDGKPIKNMTYDEWVKAKHPEVLGQPIKPTIDYSKYGGKEVFDIISKYKDYDEMYNDPNISSDDYATVSSYLFSQGKISWNEKNALFTEVQEQKKAFDEATKKYEKQSKLKGTKAQNELKKAEDEVSKIEKEITDKGADKKFSGIWYGKDVTYADWEDKKDSIQSKKEWYESNNKKQADNFISLDLNMDHKDHPELWEEFASHKDYDDFINDKKFIDKLLNIPDKDGVLLDEDDLEDVWNVFKGSQYTKLIEGNLKHLKDLEEFEKHGEEYSKLLKSLDEAKKKVKDLTPKPEPGKAFMQEAYTQDRKDKAVWAKSSREADKKFRQATKDVWKDATADEKYAAWDYTAGSGKFNRPLRGYQGSWHNNVGVGNVPLDYEGGEKEIHTLTGLLEKSALQQDTWLQRGVETMDGLSNFVKIPTSTLRNATQDELEQLLLGKEISDEAFMSCGSAKGTGFSGSILNIYCPKGTQALYVEPFSAFGQGDGKNWDGISDQSYFGSELETLLQRNTHFRVTKVEKSSRDKIYIDIEVIDQTPHAIKYN